MNTYEHDKKIFLDHKSTIINELGKEALNTEECNYIGKKYLGKHWGGCVPWNKVHLAPNKYYIVNTSSDGHPGIHWMGLVTTNKHAYLWDSYNRSVKKMLPHLVHQLVKHGYQLGTTSHPMDQIGHSSHVCGQESLSWLLTVHDIGIPRASHI